jgi:hypothetical protein
MSMLIGCASGNKSIALDNVPNTGSYALMAKDSKQPIAICTLRAGERIGFQFSPDGKRQTAAVAGARLIPLPPSGGEYHWEPYQNPGLMGAP